MKNNQNNIIYLVFQLSTSKRFFKDYVNICIETRMNTEGGLWSIERRIETLVKLHYSKATRYAKYVAHTINMFWNIQVDLTARKISM
jgi:hypothetical protein